MFIRNFVQFCINWRFILFILCLVAVHFCFGLTKNDPLHTCRSEDYKYDFTECDSFGGRWRVSVPVSPGICTGGAPSMPIRVNKCYTSCEGGQYFNMTSLLCQDCTSGHYSLGGGVIIDAFNDSLGQLPSGFNIATESTRHTPELNKKCHGWHVDPASNQLVSTILANPHSSADEESSSEFGSGCVSVVTYTVKVVKSGRLRFMYHYRIPDDVSSSLLFTFHYRLYANGESMFQDESKSNIRFPMPTMEQTFEIIDVNLAQPGLYVFTFKSVLIGNLRGLISTNRNSGIQGSFGAFVGNGDSDNDEDKSTEMGLFKNRLSTGIIRIKKIVIEGVAYASECTPCEPGTFAANAGMRECQPCPQNTAFSGFGASQCQTCNATTEYASRGSTHCRKRPICGLNDFYSIPIGKCDAQTKQQKVQYKWIEPRICIDSNNVFPIQDGTINCTESASEFNKSECDLGSELKVDGISEFCQFCPKSYYRCKESQTCQPCPPFTSPFYALSVFKWNSSLPAWSTTHMSSNFSSVLSEDYFADNPKYLNAFFTRQCIRSDQDTDIQVEKRDQKSNYYGNEFTAADVNDDSNLRPDECDSRIAWQPFHDHIRTGASSMLDSYQILSISIPGFRSIIGGEISFVFETHCENGDNCDLLFVETINEESELQELKENAGKGNSAKASDENRASVSRRKYITQQSPTNILQEWKQSSNGRLSFRHKIDRNISVNYSWVFQRSTSFQSYAKIYSLMLTNSLIGSAIECKNCPFQSLSTPNQCVTCPDGKYLEVANSQMTRESNSSVRGVMASPDNYQCKQCPPNHVLNTSVALPLGIESCLPCGPNLITDSHGDICFSNCSITFGDDTYDLRQLPQPFYYRGGNLFTAGGTQFLHLFKISLCGHPKHSPLSTCLNNITGVAEDGGSAGVRSSFICRSTMIPDGSNVYSTQSVSLGDELIGISRDTTFQNITVHPDFLIKSNQVDTDYHLFFTTKSATNACPTGRRLSISLRCNPEVENTHPGNVVVSTPHSCPDGTCDGCTFHLLIETGTAAACRMCRPFSNDYETLVGQCVDGLQQVHYINPKGCVIKKIHEVFGSVPSDVLTRPCTVLLPRNVQIGIAFVIALGLLLMLLVFHFWNQNRSLEYKYSKLIENSGKGDDDDDDNCCAEDQDEEEDNNSQQTVNSSHQLIFSDNEFEKNRNIPKESRNKQHNRIDKKKSSNLGSSHEMQQLFGKSDQSISLLGNSTGNNMDEEGYETIHLTTTDANQIV